MGTVLRLKLTQTHWLVVNLIQKPAGVFPVLEYFQDPAFLAIKAVEKLFTFTLPPAACIAPAFKDLKDVNCPAGQIKFSGFAIGSAFYIQTAAAGIHSLSPPFRQGSHRAKTRSRRLSSRPWLKIPGKRPCRFSSRSSSRCSRSAPTKKVRLKKRSG